MTKRYLRVAYGAKQGCVKAHSRGSAAVKHFRAYKTDIGSSSATVTLRPVGGLYDGEKLTVSLVKENGRWKVNSLKSNAPVGP